MRHLYLAATGQNRGKTTTSLGLLDLFRLQGLRTGFMKPVGQRTVIEAGVPADEDAVLMKAVFDLPEPLAAMSPVHIPRGFTKSYIAGEVVEDLGARIRAAHATFADHELLLVEGTGHAGVGAVVGLSNAVVAAMLGTPAVIVSGGGVGRPIDEIVLNAALFAAHGVPVAGAIVNKVEVETQPGIERTLERGLAMHGIPLLGILPYRPILSNPSLAMVAEGVPGELVNGGSDLDLVIGAVGIAAMHSDHVLERLKPGTLVIVPGDREELLLRLLDDHVDRARTGRSPIVCGLILTGYRPSGRVVEAIRAAGLFALFNPEDTYTLASAVHDLLVKTHAADTEKIALIKALVREHLPIDRLLEAAAPAGG